MIAVILFFAAIIIGTAVAAIKGNAADNANTTGNTSTGVWATIAGVLLFVVLAVVLGSAR